MDADTKIEILYTGIRVTYNLNLLKVLKIFSFVGFILKHIELVDQNKRIKKLKIFTYSWLNLNSHFDRAIKSIIFT